MAQVAPPAAPPRPDGLHRRVFASLLRYPRFRLLWVSNLFFFGGVWTQTLILGWLVFDTTGSEFRLAVFTAVRLAPMMLGPLSGVVSDRFDRARLLLAASGWALAVVLLLLSVLVSAGAAPYWLLVTGGLCLGLAQSPSQPARSTLVLDFVGRESLSNANALNSIVMNMTQVIGPAIGGAMISALGAPGALWVSTAWFAVSLVTLWPLRHTAGRVAHAGGESLRRLVSSGIRAVLDNRLATAVLLITLLANILLWPIYQAFMPVFAKVHLGLDAGGLGWLLTCSGLGGLVGSLIIAALGDFRYKGAMFVVGTAIWGTLWVAFAASSVVPVSFVLLAGVGLASSAFGVLQTTLLLMLTPPAVQGRVLGLQELAIGVMPLATIMLGAVAEILGVAGTTMISGSLLVLFLVGLALAVPSLLRYSGRT
ncbi:MFS transporter [Actinocatenispora thailandica]|uniref:MFS transporter n=1 Tax=Actinocatenispora thailandica TaxID=227318 RepID=A0A7R7DSN0_9ACTN|nr:MFS transporter [Actinocatenispora thailandica]BCJ37120.1 MFS transporter [Actinocatenispora thailandica]